MLSKPNFEYPEDRIARQNAAIVEELAAHQVNLDAMSESEMRRLATRLASRLPQNSLNGLNLEAEMVSQLGVVKNLQDEVIHDGEIPANQRAQVAGQVASVLQQLVKMQVDLKRDEQLKRLENALLKAVATLPQDSQEVFFDTYRELAITEGVEVNE
jgi:hypothetical protein